MVFNASSEARDYFLVRVDWLPVTSRSYLLTDNCKISMMIVAVALCARLRATIQKYCLV